MPSILPGYEYDIFISYRQKDNKYDGWVTEFVDNLKKELEATIKDDVTIYFDINQLDGLLETHNVDASLKDKLKCLVFIPVISQTYCDQRSFAWQNEFIAFNRIVEEDAFGRDIRLSTGNVASRILPVKIHDIDPEDRKLLENELGGVLRSVDFIFKSPGVNRPLKPDDSRSDSLTRTYYRDQINKVANAVKDIINSMRSAETGNKKIDERRKDSIDNGVINSKRKKFKIVFGALLAVLLAISGFFLVPLISGKSDEAPDKSIAVLPFEVMSKDPDQEYLGNGFAESIITALDEINGLKVIGRTSSFQFKGEKADLRDIGQKLQVSTILEGSVQVSGNDLRISVKLIDAKDGSEIWTQGFTRNYTMDNLFAIQDEITMNLVKKFKMSAIGDSVIEEPPTKSKEAYEMMIQGNYFLNQGPAGGIKALEFFQNAIKIDSGYADAYLGLSLSYFFTGKETEMKEALDKALQLNANETKYHQTLAGYYFIYEWNWEGVRKEHEELLRINSPGSIAYAWYLAALYGNFTEAVNEMQIFLRNDPLHNDGLRNMSTILILNKQYEEARRNLQKIIVTNPDYAAAYNRIGYSYYIEGNFAEAIKNYDKAFDLSGQLSSKIEIVIALAHSGKKDEAKKLFDQILIENKSLNQKNFVIGAGIGAGYAAAMALVYFSFDEPDEAFVWLNKAYDEREALMIGLKIDPIYDPYRKDPRFISIYKKMNFPE